jgi:hypothetical protein
MVCKRQKNTVEIETGYYIPFLSKENRQINGRLSCISDVMSMSPESHFLGFTNIHRISLVCGPKAEELQMIHSECCCQFHRECAGRDVLFTVFHVITYAGSPRHK